MKLHILFVVQFLWIAMQIASIAMQPVSNNNKIELQPITVSANESQMLKLTCQQGEHIFVTVVQTYLSKIITLKCPNRQFKCSNTTYDATMKNFTNSCRNKEYCEAVINDSFFGQQCKGDVRRINLVYVCSPYEMDENGSAYFPTNTDNINLYDYVQQQSIQERKFTGCEGEVVNMNCNDDKLVLKSIFISVNNEKCTANSFIPICSESYYLNLTQTFKNTCSSSKTSCSFVIGSNIFGSQCNGDIRYLEITYQCKKIITDKILVDSSSVLSPTMTLEGCEGSNLNLNCPTGEYILPINSYLQINSLKCGFTGGAKCSDSVYNSTLATITRTCRNKETCVLSINDNLFGDMCIGDKRYMIINYSCSVYKINDQDILIP